MILWGDLETYSETPIKSGVYRYAENCEIMLFTYAIDNNEPQAWDLTADEHMPDDLGFALLEADAIVFQNAMFDRTVKRLARNTTPLLRGVAEDLPRWRDTMVQAYCHALPGALEKLCDVFGVPEDQRKKKEGRQLVQLFCKPRPKNMKLRRATRKTHPEEWRRFVEYAKSDITAMRYVSQKMPWWNYQGTELALWHLDQRINDRGFAVDLELVDAAIRAVKRAQKGLSRQTHDMTNGAVESATQRDALLAHLLAEYGVELPDMQKSTLERRMEDPDLPDGLRELLAVRLQTATTSAAKYERFKTATCRDGRIRGTLQFSGAGRTARWAGRVVQPQNFPRPKLLPDEVQFGIEAMKADAEDLVFSNVMELTSSALRGCIVAPPGRKLVVSDLSNIEGRKLAWLANEHWKLKAFADFDRGVGHDLYALAYAKSFGISPEAVMENKKTGDGQMRQIGKVQELGLGYQGGVGAFITFAATYKMDLDELTRAALPVIPADVLAEAVNFYEFMSKEGRTLGLPRDTFIACDSLKRLWRRAHPNVVQLWHGLEDAARDAILHEGVPYQYNRLICQRDGNWLRIQLPSGRFLCYPSPRVSDAGEISYMGVNTYSRKWSRIKTYGGKLVENATQASARDVLAYNMPRVEDAGYEIILTVHDEVITETDDTSNYTEKQLSGLLATNPPWATGLPLAAGGFEGYRYRKE